MPDRRRYARTPDTIAFLAACSMAGIAMTISGWAPGSVLAIASPLAAYVWSSSLALSAGLALGGVLWPEDITGWILETVGRAGLCLALGGYAFALSLVVSNPGSLFVVAIITALAAASGVRVYQLVRRWREFIAWAKEVRR